MKKVIIILFLMFLVFSSFIHAEKVAVITEVLKPTAIVMDEKQLYVSESTTIYIYSLDDFKLVKKFGKTGEGPQEFLYFASVYPRPDDLLINSLGKISFFTRDGTYLKEIKTRSSSNLAFFPLKEGFVGLSQLSEDNVYYYTVNIFNDELTRGKEIGRMRIGDPNKKIELLKRTLTYQVYGNKIYVIGSEKFAIDVFDHSGNKLYAITRPYERIKFDPRFEKEIRDAIKKGNPQQYEFLKDRLDFPEYFSVISFLFIDNGKILVGTWNLQGNNLEFYFLSSKGELLKKQFVAIVFREGSLNPYPLTFKGGQLYQLIENEEEEWELHKTKID